MSHVEAETLMRYADGLLGAEAEAELTRHLAECAECHKRAKAVQDFNDRLKTEWVGARLRAIIPEEWGCPPPDELSRYFLGESERADRRRLETHLEGCAHCRETVAEMERGYAILARADPLRAREPATAVPWWERLQAVLRPFPWPAWALATVAVGLAFMAGLLLYPVLLRPPDLLPHLETFRITKPPFTPPAELPALGIAPAYHPEADKRFREAMAFYDDPAFPEKAIPKLREAVTLDPRHEQAQFWLGIAYLLKDETTSAIPPLEEGVRLAPAKMEYKQYLVWAYLKVGQVEKALRLQTELLERQREPFPHR